MNSDEAHLDNCLLVIQMRLGRDVLFAKACRCLLGSSDLLPTLGQPWCEVYHDFVETENAAPQDLPER